MKFKFLKLIVVVCLAVCFLTAAAQSEYSLELQENFLVAEKGENTEKICTLTGASKESVASEFAKGGLLVLGVTKDGKTQIKLNSFADNFSGEVHDISNLSADALDEYALSLSNRLGGHYKIENSNGRDFVVLTQKLADSGGEYICTQYLTICNGKVYCLTCFDDLDQTSAQSKQAFKALTLTNIDLSSNDKSNRTEYILMAAGIFVFAVVAGWMLIGIIKDGKFLASKTSEKEREE